ncbi:MAG TPA: universal stress protein [Longimicrobiales bacterium]|nr:universal stress protein [Longimicrobiales bacterium]
MEQTGMIKRLLVGTDGSAATWGAIRFAAAMAREHGVEVHVLAVLEPLTRAAGALSIELPHFEEVERIRSADLERRVVDLVNGAFERRDEWSLSVRSGVVAASVAQEARDVEADLVVLGRRFRPASVPAGHSTALEILALAPVPVLVAARDLAGLPRVALAAVDFGEASRCAARTSLEILTQPGGRLKLVHVIPPLDFPAAVLWGWSDTFARQVPCEFERFTAALDAPPGLDVSTEVAKNDPGTELLTQARDTGADLIVAGSHGYLYRDRVLVGTVARRLLREASASVLLAPAGDMLAHGARAVAAEQSLTLTAS